MNEDVSLTAPVNFTARETIQLGQKVGALTVDLRRGDGLGGERSMETIECRIHDARSRPGDFTLDTAGFTLLRRPSATRDWFDNDEVMSVYYEECKQLARELTGATHVFTFDHLIREHNRQTGGGGLFKKNESTTGERGGGYGSFVHMDFSDHSTSSEYLALYGLSEPQDASRVIVLDFWRPLFDTAEREPLAICDARTVTAEDLQETLLYGYGHKGYSWHDIGISMYNVGYSPRHEWYYYSNMMPEEVLVMKLYDSLGVIGRACPHSSFTNPSAPATAPSRCSVELRVHCYIGAH
jgi:hypothetical protein